MLKFIQAIASFLNKLVEPFGFGYVLYNLDGGALTLAAEESGLVVQSNGEIRFLFSQADTHAADMTRGNIVLVSMIFDGKNVDILEELLNRQRAITQKSSNAV